MKYDLTAKLFPLIFDKYAYALFGKEGVHLSKKKVRSVYRAMVETTPPLSKGDSFTGNLLMGCYALAFYKAYPDLISDTLFHQLVLTLCSSKPMVDGHKKEDAFDEKMLIKKEKDAVLSQDANFEMGWKFTLQRNEDSYDLTYMKCGLCQLGKRENCFHLIRYLCEADFITYDLMGADLRRTQTLANGGSCCDFHVSKKEKKE